MCNLCAKGFFDYEFNSADIDKISNFNEIASNFTYLRTSKFIKYNLTDTDHLLLKSKFYGRGKSGMYFCIFGSCQPLKFQDGRQAKMQIKQSLFFFLFFFFFFFFFFCFSLTHKWPNGVATNQHLFFAHFTTFTCAFLTISFSNCLTIGYASFDAKEFKSTPSFSCQLT